MPGRPPTPTPVLKATGAFRRDRHAAREGVSYPAGRPTCPSFLKGEAKAEWNRAVDQLERARVLSRVDRALLAAWCLTWADYVAAEGVVRRRVLDTLLKIGREFGFTPTSRVRATTAEPAPQVEELEKFLEDGNAS